MRNEDGSTFPSSEAKSIAGGEGRTRLYRPAVAIAASLPLCPAWAISSSIEDEAESGLTPKTAVSNKKRRGTTFCAEIFPCWRSFCRGRLESKLSSPLLLFQIIAQNPPYFMDFANLPLIFKNFRFASHRLCLRLACVVHMTTVAGPAISSSLELFISRKIRR